jgi:hypothetical protein
MKLALLSDIHANLRALHACLAHAQEAGATHHAVLGDLTGYGAEPAQVVDAVMHLAARGAVVLGGNHDALAVQPPAQPQTHGDLSAAWTHGQLDAAQCAFLAGCRCTRSWAAPGWCMPAPMRPPTGITWTTPTAPSAAWRRPAHPGVKPCVLRPCAPPAPVLPGHRARADANSCPRPGVPVPVPPHRQWVATVGSVGQPRDGDPRAMYALLDTDALAACALSA